MKVCDLMTSEVATVTPTMSLRDAAALLAAKGISGVPVLNTENEVVGVLSEADIVVKAGGEVARNRLPVVDKGKLVGIITRADIVRAFTRSDTELVDEIRGDILRRTFWLEPGRVTVNVVDGHVTLRGEVETETDQELLPHFVARVPGVISVDADLSSRSRVRLAR